MIEVVYFILIAFLAHHMGFIDLTPVAKAIPVIEPALRRINDQAQLQAIAPKKKEEAAEAEAMPWNAGPWLTCEADGCGEGKQSRSVDCPKEPCVKQKPETTRACRVPCKWDLGNWSLCSKACGTGIRTRAVSCKTPPCNEKAPPSEKACNPSACKNKKVHRAVPIEKRVFNHTPGQLFTLVVIYTGSLLDAFNHRDGNTYTLLQVEAHGDTYFTGMAKSGMQIMNQGIDISKVRQAENTYQNELRIRQVDGSEFAAEVNGKRVHTGALEWGPVLSVDVKAQKHASSFSWNLLHWWVE
jgi:hypothetical protein